MGAALSRRTGLPLVLDYRDEWELSNACWENKRLGPFSVYQLLAVALVAAGVTAMLARPLPQPARSA